MSQHSWSVSVVVWVERLCPFLVGGVMLLAGLLGGGPTEAGAQDPVDLHLSGYELFPGIDCKRSGAPATCGVTFGGWTGGNGAVPGGWSPYPGDHHGFWEVTLDRQGTAAFESTVTALDGIFTLALKKGKSSCYFLGV